MKNIINYLVLLTFVLLVSCSPATPVNQSLISTFTASPDKTPTISPPTASALPTTSPTSSAEQCLDFRQDLPANLEGEIVLVGKNSLYQPALGLHETPPYILVPATGNRLTLPQESGDEVGDFSVSPDKKWLAYFAQQSDTVGTIYIIGNDGTLFKTYPAGNWWGVLGWLDNNRLLISKFGGRQNPYSSLIFDPFTSKIEQELLPNYPDIFTGYSGELFTWGKYQLPETVYNPDLSMVVYPRNPNTIVLWDVIAKKQNAEINDRSASSHAPLWLSSGKEFIIDVTAKNTADHWYQDELMSVGIDGQVEQLTHLADLNYVNVAIQNYSESADGHYIAIWFAQVSSGPSRLAIYDTVTGNTKVLCAIVGGYVPPVWLPSGYQLLVDGTFDSLENYGTVYVDVESGLLAQVEKGVIPIGWMVAP